MYSLRTRLTLTHALVVLLALLLVGVLSSLLVNAGFQQLGRIQAQRDAEQIADTISTFGSTAPTGVQPLTFIQQRLQAPKRPPVLRNTNIPFVLSDARMQVVFDRAGELEGKWLPFILRRTAAPIIIDDQTIGYVAVPAERRALTIVERSVLGRIYLGVLASSVLAGFVAIMVGRAISRYLTRPLQALTVASERLTNGGQLEPVAITTRDEVGNLAQAFNTMAQELAHQQQLRRNLVADIAHELRTPLSVLRLQVEALQDGVEAPSPASFASLSEEVNMLSHLVDDLRLLSLADAGQLRITCTELDPAELGRRSLAFVQPRAVAQQIDLCCQIDECLPPIQADAQRLVQVINGLLDNALRYTPTGGRVRLRITTATAPRRDALPTPYVTFIVSDSGSGIAPTDLPHVFDRFYRADGARTRETGGSGLGLAIAQRLVEAMGGQIWAESPPGSGASFFVALPSANPVMLACS